MSPNVSVVIPSIKEDILTLDSVPEEVSVSIEREGSLNEARNRGVRNSDSKFVAILDDDIAFSENIFWSLVDLAAEDTLLGVVDWEFGLVAGRVMVFPKSLWETVGGFDERLRSHNGDTDFSLRTHKQGYNIVTVSRDVFHHKEHDRSITTWDRAWRLLYLCKKHPRYAPYLLSSTLAYNLSLKLGIDQDTMLPPGIHKESGDS